MGSITSGVGLASGLDIKGIVEKLVSLEGRSAVRLKDRVDANTSLKGLFDQLTVRLADARLSVSNLSSTSTFGKRSATASSDAVSASAGLKTPAGSYTVTPRRLVSTSQVLSAGFGSATDKVGAGTIRIAQGGFVDAPTKLDVLNGGTGVAAGSVRLTDRLGRSAVVDLSGAATIQDVVATINETSGIGVRASLSGKSLTLTDSTGGAGTILAEEVAGGRTAADLGLTSLSGSGAGVTGAEILKLDRNLDLRLLNGGNGVRNANGGLDFRIQTGAGSYDVSLFGLRTVGDVLSAIGTASGGNVTASVTTGGRLQLSGAGTVTVTALSGSLAANDLGILGSATGTLTGTDVLGGLGSTLLTALDGGFRGGTDVAPQPGSLSITGAAAATIDLTGVTTLEDVLGRINAQSATTGVTAAVNSARNGITLTRDSGGNITVADVSGNLGSFLKLNGTGSGTIESGDLNAKFVNENTSLATYQFGTAVPKGKFRITDASGASAVIDLTQDSDDTIGDVITEINSKGLGITARINDTGDGLLLSRTSGTAEISVAEVDGGTTAAALGISGTSTAGLINAKRKVEVTTTATDTLNDVITKLASAKVATASLINDGSTLSPIRLSLTSGRSGQDGELVIDPGTTSLRFSTTSRGRDAVLLYGASGGGSTPVRLVSNKNTFDGLVPGLVVEAKRASTDPVTVNVAANTDAVVEDIKAFVDGLTSIRTLIAENSKFNASTGEKGAFFNDQSVRLASTQINDFLGSSFAVGGAVRSLGQLGIEVNDKGEIEFDESTLREAIAANPEDVEALFGTASTGVKARFETLVDSLSSATGGTISDRLGSLQRTIENQNKSLESMNARLEARQNQLLKKFYAMESAVSSLQSQQSALTRLSSIATSFASSSRR